MDEIIVDRSQLMGEVKERNKFYRALVQIQNIANEAISESKVGEKSSLVFNGIVEICDESLEEII